MKRGFSSWALLNHTYLRCVLAEAYAEAELPDEGLRAFKIRLCRLKEARNISSKRNCIA